MPLVSSERVDNKKIRTKDQKVVLDTTRNLSNNLLDLKVEKTVSFSIQQVMGISTILNSSLSLQEIKDLVTDSLRNLFDAEGCSIYLWNEEKELLEFDVVKGHGAEEFKKIQLEKGEGIAGRIIKDPQARIIDDAQNHIKFNRSGDNKSGNKTRNMMCAPIEIRGKLIGVLQVVNKKGDGDFLPEELDLLVGTSNNLGMAISNARAFELEQEKARILEDKNIELKENMTKNILTLAKSIGTRDLYTGDHTERVMHYSDYVAQALGFTERQREVLRNAARLHDIGKIGIPDSILLKNEKLTDEEYAIIKTHPEISEKMLSYLDNSSDLKQAIRGHHERWDGNGYPDRLAGTDIPLCARIIAVVDSFDAMTTNRPYRRTLPLEVAINELKKGKGTQFDPKIVDIFLEILKQLDVEEFKARAKAESQIT